MTTVKTREQCPKCQDSGRDNLVQYSDGGAHCFGCGYHVNSTQLTRPNLAETGVIGQPVYGSVGEHRDLPHRKISEAVCKHFDYELGHDGEIANYYQDNNLVGQKIRTKDKDFYINGTLPTLFGQQNYAPQDNTFITITEGEIDALSIAEAQGVRFPVVSIPNGAQGAKKAISAQLKYLQGFKHVVLCFDNDEAGQEAAKECAALFEPGFARIARLPLKDANEMLVAGRASEITGCLFNAQAIRPEGIIQLSEIKEQEIKDALQPGIPIKYPLLNDMLNGLRKQSLYTLVARAKSGKTTLTKEIVLDLVNKNHKVGVLYLEEDAVAEALSFVAMEENKPQWQFMDELSSDPLLLPKIQERLKSYADRGLYLYNHKGVIDSKSVYDTVNYMVKGLDCEIIVLDNVSISIAGTDATANERKLIDNMVYDLVKLINNTKCTIITVVHVNQKGESEEKLSRKDVFGSGAFLKFSRGLIAMDRDEDGLVQLSVLGNRAKGLEGAADTLKYNQETGRLEVYREVI